jgi:hypothetical protein
MQEGNIEDDVFRISDIVRGAHSMVIAIGPGQRDIEGQTSTESMLQHWGERLWTLPEALLITSKKPISVYRRGFQEPLLIPKNQFAAMAWADSVMTRQLVDHYEGTLILSRLELVTIAMQCLFVRKSTEYLPVGVSMLLFNFPPLTIVGRSFVRTYGSVARQTQDRRFRHALPGVRSTVYCQ